MRKSRNTKRYNDLVGIGLPPSIAEKCNKLEESGLGDVTMSKEDFDKIIDQALESLFKKPGCAWEYEVVDFDPSVHAMEMTTWLNNRMKAGWETYLMIQNNNGWCKIVFRKRQSKTS